MTTSFNKTLGLILVLLGVVCGLLILFYAKQDDFKKSVIPPRVLKNSRITEIFKLENNKELSFPLLALASEVRIATNAEFSPNIDLRQSSNKENYIIEVAAYDYKGTLIETRKINYATKAQFYFSKDLGMYLSSYFLDSENLPSETRIGSLNFTDVSKVAEVRIKRIDSNPNLSNIYARVYQKGGVSESRLNFYWFNVMKGDKKRLASANLYPVDMMRESERMNLIRNLWTVATPVGVPQKDFISKKLYNVNNPIGIPYDVSLLHSGNYIDDLHSIVIPINEDKSDININIISADIIYPKYMKIWLMQPQDNINNILKLMQEEKGTNNITTQNLQYIQGQKAEIIWRGRGLNQTLKYQLDINNRYFSNDYKFDAGVLIINSNMPAYVNVSKKINDNKVEPIMSNPMGSNLISLNPNSYVEFEVFHNNSKYNIFRFDLRYISEKIFIPSSISKINYELLNNEQKVIKSGIIALPNIPTKFDFTVTRQGLYLSERVKYYFTLTPEVTKIRFQAEPEIFISAYNRIDEFERYFIIPKDYKTSQDREESLRRTWFFKTPLDYEYLRSDLRTILVKSQNKIIEENAQVKEGIYDWQEILPKGDNWSAVEIIEKKSTAIKPRSEAESTQFSPIMTNTEYEIEFSGNLGERNVAPTIIYTGEIGTKIEIYIDGVSLINTNTTNHNGEINLPHIPTGKHKILIKTDKILDTALNYLAEDLNSSIKHNVINFKRPTYEFIVEKTSDQDQAITLKSYSLGPSAKYLAVSIVPLEQNNVVANEPTSSYTIKKRKYEISFTRNPENIKFVDNLQLPLYGAEPIYIKLGSDLKAGRYNISLTASDYQGFYVALSKLTPGLIDNRKISIEVEDEN